MTEIQPYRVVGTLPNSAGTDIELREYPQHVVVNVDARGDFLRAGNLGFQPLLRYISGANASRTPIAMTAPVIQQPRTADDHTISFVLPAELTDAPAPTDARVRTRVVPPGQVAALRFAGGANETRFAERGRELAAAVAAAGRATEGEVYFARYDPPWKPGFLKRNEALLRLAG